MQNILSQSINKSNEVESIKPEEQKMTVRFVCMNVNQEIANSYSCKKSDLFVNLEERLYEEFPQFKKYDTYYLINTKRVKRYLTLEQNEIKDKDIINIYFIEE